MKNKITSFLVKFVLAFLVFFSTSLVSKTTAQSITLDNLLFTQICANPSFKSFGVCFTPSGAFPSGNSFFVELSDATGSFANPVNLNIVAPYPFAPTCSGSSLTLFFEIPTNITGGSGYKIRIKSALLPTVISNESNSFEAQYLIYNTQIILNDNSGTANICSGGSVTLAILNPTPTIIGSSAATYPFLKYRWKYKPTALAPETNVPGGSGVNITSITVSNTGIYRVEIDYGGCTASSLGKSAEVTVGGVGAGLNFTIISSRGNLPACQNNPATLSASGLVGTGFIYQWIKDGVDIAVGGNSATYTTAEAGNYQLRVLLTGCPFLSNIKQITNPNLNAAIDIVSPAIIVIGETLTINASSSVAGVTYQWYTYSSTGVATAIPLATNSSYTATAEGDYSVIITNNDPGCVSSEEIKFTLNKGTAAKDIPNVVSPNNDGINDTWIIPQKYLTGAKAQILILNSQGKTEFESADYKNNWPEKSIDFTSVNPVYYYIINKDNQETKGTITVIK
jgi:CHU_C Type IX secretion signal domain